MIDATSLLVGLALGAILAFVAVYIGAMQSRAGER